MIKIYPSFFSCRPGRPPKRNLFHQTDDYSENKHLFNFSTFTPPLNPSNNHPRTSKSYPVNSKK